VKDFTEKVRVVLGEETSEIVKTDREVLATFQVDGMTPGAVAFPKNTKQVADLVTLANNEKLAIVPWGSGSKMAMGHPPRRLDLVISTARMNHLLDVDTANLTITVEAGVKFRDIQARLATQEDRCYLPLEDLKTEGDDFICSDRSHSGCFVPLDPCCAGSATIGGIMAAASTGPRRLLYNLPRDMILGVRFVGPKGDIRGSGGKTVKNVSGYDVSKLMVGSMGSLGILCELTVRALPLPERMETLLFSFASFEEAGVFADSALAARLLPAAVEVMTGAAFEHLGGFQYLQVPRQGCVVAVALEAFDEAVIRMEHELVKIAEKNDLGGHQILDEHDHLSFWLAFSDLGPALDREYPGLIRAKLNYRISEWHDIVARVSEILDENGLSHAVTVHAGSGICVVNLLLDDTDSAACDRAVEALERILERSVQGGGNTVILRAPVEIKPRLQIWGKAGPDLIAMRRLKEHLDPAGVMSPGRFVGGL
jgi:FAD/FMN-containing dehydrogenase